MHAGRLMLMVLVGGPIAGSLTALAIDPTMKAPPEPPWRKLVESTYVPKPIYEIVESGPQDLSPLFSPPRLRMLERQYLEAAAQRRFDAYDNAPLADAPDPPRGIEASLTADETESAAAATVGTATRDAGQPSASEQSNPAVIIVDPEPQAEPDLLMPEDAAA